MKQSTKKPLESSCDSCEFFDWDEDMQENVCILNLDEDEYYRMMTPHKTSPRHPFGCRGLPHLIPLRRGSPKPPP